MPGAQAAACLTTTIDANGAEIYARVGGHGPGLVLLHGYPQTHAMWHRIAPALARRFTVAAIDLRGCGDSSCPPTDLGHAPYSKRTMAADVAAVADALGFASFALVGHDRGGRVAYRLALDSAHRIERLVLLDIIPTPDQWQLQSQGDIRLKMFHWAFLAQPAPIPESLIGANPDAWLDGRFKRGTRDGSLDVFDARALAAYRRSLADPDRLHATCEDFRAGARLDLEQDLADRRAGRRIRPPTLVLWATSGPIGSVPDIPARWQAWCEQAEVHTIDSGHFMAEECPDDVLHVMLPFLDRDVRSPT